MTFCQEITESREITDLENGATKPTKTTETNSFSVFSVGFVAPF
jgi:hypothetical protein